MLLKVDLPHITSLPPCYHDPPQSWEGKWESAIINLCLMTEERLLALQLLCVGPPVTQISLGLFSPTFGMEAVLWLVDLGPFFFGLPDPVVPRYFRTDFLK